MTASTPPGGRARPHAQQSTSTQQADWASQPDPALQPGAAQPDAAQSAAAPKSKESVRQRRLAMVSSYLGTTVEYYDFLLFGTASALVFPHLFFPAADPLVGTLASFAGLAVGYFARPLGAVVFGHFGDKLGRKKMLVLTLVIMGGVSTFIGLMPTYAMIGIWAPILLIGLRLVQGLAVGGEWAGAALMSMEHSGPKQRGFAASVVASGGPSGAVLATLVLTPFSMFLDEAAFQSWGWRIPFFLSAALVGIGLIIRSRVHESPEFAEARRKKGNTVKAAELPILAIFKHNSPQVLAGTLGALAPLFMQSILATFLLTYAVNVAGYERSTALWLVTIANALHIFTIPLCAALSDRIGRKPVMIAGAIAGIILIAPMFALIQSGNPWLLLAAFCIGNPIVQAIMYGPLGAWIGEKFAADVRYTGMAVTYQIGTTLGAGLAPLAATSLLALGGGTNPIWVIAFFIALCILSATAYFFSEDRHGSELATITGSEATAELQTEGAGSA